MKLIRHRYLEDTECKKQHYALKRRRSAVIIFVTHVEFGLDS